MKYKNLKDYNDRRLNELYKDNDKKYSSIILYIFIIIILSYFLYNI